MKAIVTIAITLILSVSLHGQSFYHVIFPGDTLEINHTDYCGQSIEWQRLEDGEWVAIPGTGVNPYFLVANHTEYEEWQIRSSVTVASDTIAKISETVGVRFVTEPAEVQLSDKYQGLHIYHNINDTLYAAYRTTDEAEWGCIGTVIENAFGQEIGDGIHNTNAILSGCDTNTTAAYVCDTMTALGYDDWFLPSRAELYHIALYLTDLSAFDFNERCWTSTQRPKSINAWNAEDQASSRFFPWAQNHPSYADKDIVMNIVASRFITDFPNDKTVIDTKFQAHEFWEFIRITPAEDSFTTVVVEFLGEAPSEADFHWEFEGGEVLSGTGVGPYEVMYTTSEKRQVRMTYDNSDCQSPVFMSSFFHVRLFEPITKDLPEIYGGCVRFGDFNNDGLEDIICTGSDTSLIRLNDGEGGWNLHSFSPPGLFDAYVSMGDFDNDDLLDFVLSGTSSQSGLPYVGVYRNLGGDSFEAINTDLPQLTEGFVEWLDFNNDGALDVLVSGVGIDGIPTTGLFAGDKSGTFTEVGTVLPDLTNSFVSFEDYNRDGYVDILINGWDGNDRLMQLFENQSGVFSLTDLELTGIDFGESDWADYDEDGQLDFVYSGNKDSIIFNASGSSISVDPRPANSLFFYRSIGGSSFVKDSLIPEMVGFPDYFSCSSLDWGDYNSDGLDDLMITGIPDITWASTGVGGSTPALIKRSMPTLYQNKGMGTFRTNPADVPVFFAGVGTYGRPYPVPDGFFECASVKFGNINQDGNIDILREGRGAGHTTEVYVSKLDNINESPSVPNGLVAEPDCRSVRLSWEESLDDNCIASNISYEFYLGTAPGAGDVFSKKNQRKLRDTTFLVSDLNTGVYYWGVRSVDNALNSSDYSIESSFEIAPPAPPMIYLSNDTIFAEGAGVFTWFLDGTVISGTTGNFLVVPQDGVYTNVVTVDGCVSDTSNQLNVILTKLDEVDLASDVLVFPNPSSGVFNITCYERMDYTLFDSAGKLISEGRPTGLSFVIDLSTYPVGTYQLVLMREKGEKVIKQLTKL